ncbi:DUF2332 domain-containing protein [Nocardia lijiangensis]|uniref:DUF2332 domain-containing protein n=1 Tax=Nocardia lijiangensis TaxID=299618 RepID=UPI00082FBF0D|nr:DUF2332 domain-containing protein [Nocardia lijiangensis]
MGAAYGVGGVKVDTAQRYRRFAQFETHGHSPCYTDWSRRIADDTEVLALVEALPAAKRQPNLVLASARHVGARQGPFEEFKDFLIANWPLVRDVAMTHVTQTNEPARAAVLLPLFAEIADPEPLYLIEIGASAGLCLYPDKYSYRYDDRLWLDPWSGPSPVRLSCSTTGDPPVPERLPSVIGRVGVDLNPLDVTDAEHMRWLECLIWPEQQERLERLHRAAAIARADPPEIVGGDLNDTIEELVRAAPDYAQVVVFGSAVLAYLDAGERARFVETIRGLRCVWIANEGCGVVPVGRGLLPKPCSETRDRFVLTEDGVPVAYSGPHGQRLEWFRPG